MGNLLGAPVTDKETVSGVTDDGLPYAVSSMQGWRVHMEDAHITEGRLYAAEAIVDDDTTKTGTTTNGDNSDPASATATSGAATTGSGSTSDSGAVKYKKIDLPGHSLFGVFDGHGGSFSAIYSGNNLCRVLSRQSKFVQYAKFEKERPEKEKTLTTSAERAAFIQTGHRLLQEALSDAFVELDKEIALALRGTKVPDADTPYHDDEPDHHQQQHNDSSRSNNNTKSSENKSNNNDGTNNNNNDSMDTTLSTEETSPPDAALRLLEGEGDSGTTACVVLITPEYVVCANAGDSRSVMSKLGNKAVPLSFDHKPDDEQEERRIRAAGGYVAGGRVEGDLAVSRGLGDFRFKQLNVVMAGAADSSSYDPSAQDGGTADTDNVGQRRISGKPGDQKVSPIPDILVQNRNSEQDEFFIIACDGIWDVQTNQDAVRCVSGLFQDGESNLGLICEELCDVCLAFGSKDNMTVLIVKFAGQKIGDGGGGVMARRQRRDIVEAKLSESPAITPA